jgi:hypothetical protein
MAEVSEKTKQKIDSLSKEELLHEVSKGTASVYQREKFAYLKTRLAIVQGQEDGLQQQETLNVAKQSNIITSQTKRFAVWAIVISLVALVFQTLHYCSEIKFTVYIKNCIKIIQH